jgi:putative transposase
MDGESTVTTRQRHTPSEVATKLAMADEMTAQGRLHGDIAKSLGISVMTYHRWRKARRLAHPASRPAIDTVRAEIMPDREQMVQIRELRAENQRLRRLVTDLLLEKDKLEEGLRTAVNDRRMVHS